MYQIELMSRVPVYEQIVEQTKKFILSGVLNAGDQIPSVRQLSAQLSLNPNTIQKAVKELDRQGLIYALAGRGNFISTDAKTKLQKEKMQDLSGLEEQLKELALSGLKKEELTKLIDRIYAEYETTGEKRNEG